MFDSMKAPRLLAPALAMLPEDRYYPRVGGLLRAVIHPSQTIFNSRQESDMEATRQILEASLAGDNRDNSDPESLAADIYNTSKLNGYKEGFDDAVKELSAELEYQVNVIEDEVLPVIGKYQETYTKIRASILAEKSSKYKIVKFKLPAMFTDGTVSSTTFSDNLRPGSENVDLSPLSHLSQKQFAEVLGYSGNLLLTINEVYKYLDQSKTIKEYFDDYVIGITSPQNGVVARLALATITYILAKTMTVHVPDELSVPTDVFRNLATDLLSNVSKNLSNVVSLLDRLTKRNVILETKVLEDKTKLVVSELTYEELIVSLDEPSRVDDILKGYYLLDSSGASINSSTVSNIIKVQKEALSTYKANQSISDRLYQSRLHQDLLNLVHTLLSSSIQATEAEVEKYGSEGNPDRNAIITKAVNELTLDDLLDEWNQFIVDIIIDARFSFIPTAKAYITASIEEAKTNGLDTAKETLTVAGVTAIMLETIVSSFRY